MKKILLLSLLLFIAQSASAHQPRLAKDKVVVVSNPEISQAFYGELKGSPVEYRIVSAEPFRLYAGLLVPDIPQVKKDISAKITKVGGGKEEEVALLDGTNFEWTPFYEEFAGDNYFWGPEYSAEESKKGVELLGRTVPAGEYHVTVFSPTDEGKYSFVVGYLEKFPPLEILNSLVIVPQTKLYFFNEPFWKVITSRFVMIYILLMFVSAFIFGFILRAAVKRLRKNSASAGGKNIDSLGRWLRFLIGAGLFVLAVTTTWNPMLLFLAGFMLFEAAFGWCLIKGIIKK